MKRYRNTLCKLIVGFISVCCLAANTMASEKKDSFKVVWSVYSGWMPWAYATETGIIDKWAKKYGIQIELIQMNDYIESINQYTAGEYDGCAMTNMDALTIPAANGVDTTAIILGTTLMATILSCLKKALNLRT